MKLRVLLLADINSPHTKKWALGLAADNIEIGLFSFNHSPTAWHQGYPGIRCLWQSRRPQSNSLSSKLLYVFILPRLLYHIIRYRPNVVHAHYASSYGL